MKKNYIEILREQRERRKGNGQVVLKEVEPIIIIEKEPEPIVEQPQKRGRKKKTDDNA